MIWVCSALTVIVWAVVAVLLFVRESRYYRENPYAYDRRFDGLISLSDRQRHWCMVMWPLVVVAMIALLLLNLVVMAWDSFKDWCAPKASV